jgi:hypothetical protein
MEYFGQKEDPVESGRREYYNNRPWATAEEIAKEEEEIRILQQENEEKRRFDGQHRETPILRSLRHWNVRKPKLPRNVAPPFLWQSIRALSASRTASSLRTLSKFALNSSILTYGQMLPLYYSSLMPGNLTSHASHIPPLLEGGTSPQHKCTYRSAAKMTSGKFADTIDAAPLGGGIWKIQTF